MIRRSRRWLICEQIGRLSGRRRVDAAGSLRSMGPVAGRLSVGLTRPCVVEESQSAVDDLSHLPPHRSVQIGSRARI